MSRFVGLTTVLMLVLVLGLQWTVLQSVAWVAMLARFSQEGSLKQAIVKTFDGQHPCALCHAVKTGKEAEKKTRQDFSLTRLDLFLDQAQAIELACPRLVHPRPSNSWGTPRPERPPVPPPRTV